MCNIFFVVLKGASDSGVSSFRVLWALLFIRVELILTEMQASSVELIKNYFTYLSTET